jgi:two-component sensor histidine kinase
MSTAEQLYCLRGGGTLGRLMREHDWSKSPLGLPVSWPQSLRTATAMMLNTQQPMFIAWGPELAFTYNDAYAPILGARHPGALGLPFQEIWADIWADLVPLVERALSGEPVWQEDLPLLMHRHGYAEETFFTFTYSPLYDESGVIAGMFCTCIETTGRVLAERRLRETAELLAQSEARYREQGERLFTLFEKAPGFVAVVEGPDHVFTLANAAYRQLIGHRDVLGLPARVALPEVAPSGLFEVLDRVRATGEPFVGTGVEVPLQRTPGGAVERRYMDFIYQPVRDHSGAITGVFCQGSDVTERELFSEKQQLLLNELNHRVKNNLATVQSMAAQTARRSADLRTFIADFEGRLVALARTHDVLTAKAWSGAALQEILEGGLSPFSTRVRLHGPPVELDSTQALALGLLTHELATNAVKYGALSTAEGVVDVGWTVLERRRLSLSWRERGGPAVQPPQHRGFGTRLIERLASGDLRGELKLEFAPAGLEMTLTAPLKLGV